MVVHNTGHVGQDPRLLQQSGEENQKVQAKSPADLSQVATVTMSKEGELTVKKNDGNILVFSPPLLDPPDGNVSIVDKSDAENFFERLSSDKKALSELAEIMVLFHEIAQHMRDTSKEVRTSERELELSKAYEAADKRMEAAYDRYVGSMLAAGGQMVAGGVNAFGAFRSAWKSFGSGDNAQSLSQATNAFYQGFAQILESSMKMGSAGFELSGATKDAEAMIMDGLKKTHGDKAQDQDVMYNDMAQFLRDIRETLKEVKRLEFEAESQMIRQG